MQMHCLGGVPAPACRYAGRAYWRCTSTRIACGRSAPHPAPRWRITMI